MEENQKQESTISIGDIFRTIFSQKWLALAILVVVTIAGTVGIYFGMNSFNREYVASFVLNLPGDDGTKNYYTYPDGTTFYYSDLITKDILSSVKASDEAFKSVEVEQMADDGDISIDRKLNDTKTEATYTVHVKANYFKNKEVARKFIEKLANFPGAYLAEMNIAYDSKISNVDSLKSYENIITAFEDQCADLMKQYQQFITQYKPDFVIRDGNTLQYYLNEIDTYVNKNQTLVSLKSKVQKDSLLKSLDLKVDYENELEQVKRDLKREQFVLDEMKKVGSSDIQQNAIAIRDQAAKVAELTERQTDLDNYINYGKEADEEFKTAIKTAHETVKGFTADFKYAAETVYSVALTVSFTASNVITTAGETGIVKSLIISLIAGLILAMIIGYAVGAVKQNKKQKAAAQVTVDTRPAETEALAQAAATDAEEVKSEKQTKKVEK